MADRLEYIFTRSSMVQEMGTVAIDVLDPTDYEEILSKLNNREFVKMVVTEREYDGEDWNFAKLPSNDDN